MLSSSEVHALHIVRHKLSGLRVDASLVRLQLALKAGFNPDQPRVARGRREGGQWMRDGAGTSVPSVPTGPATPPRPNASTSPNAGVIRDETGLESWEAVVPNVRPDGVHQLVAVNRDGSLIRSEYSTSPESTGWEERHTVIRPDGEMRIFEKVGTQQTVSDRTGTVVARSTWTNSGPVPESTVQPAYFLPLVTEAGAATAELALTLFTWLSTRNGPDQQAVIAFSAREFLPNEVASGEVEFVGQLTREEVDAACPRLEQVQAMTDEAVEAVKRRGAIDLSPTEFGTAVHVKIKRQIDRLFDPNFRAEVSVLKAMDETYGTKDSVRIDVFENVDNKTVCIYDIKTGRKGLSALRAAELAEKVVRSFGAKRLLIVEVRPTR